MTGRWFAGCLKDVESIGALLTSRVIPVAPFLLVVFGTTGDLACRKPIATMFQRDVAGQLPRDATILGVSRGPLTEAAWWSKN